MAAHTHNVWLVVRREISNTMRKQNTKFLAFSPVGTKFMKEFNQAVFIVESEGVSSLILPTDVH